MVCAGLSRLLKRSQDRVLLQNPIPRGRSIRKTFRTEKIIEACYAYESSPGSNETYRS